GIIVLVPGSLGYRSLAALLDVNTLQVIDLALDRLIVGMALVGGVLMANAVISPKRIL
ncbi:MAG: threonine/serine exporter family protein, partial [Chloroflexi bacterium]|nr:threonine/serine exporter family protein [Chloroflexota bacterium]